MKDYLIVSLTEEFINVYINSAGVKYAICRGRGLFSKNYSKLLLTSSKLLMGSTIKNAKLGLLLFFFYQSLTGSE